MTGAFEDILAANRAYAADFALAGLPAPAAKGLGVLTCIDSRIEPLAMLGIHPGDAKIFRNAGARVTDDALRSLVLATNLLNVNRIMIVQHTDCAMSRTDDAELRSALRERYPDATIDDDATFGTFDDQLATLEQDVARVRAHPLIPDATIVGGFRYDVGTGQLEQFLV